MPIKMSGPRAFREEVIIERTGKSTVEWNAIIDKWGRKEKGHTKTAAYLAKEFGLSGWWAQMITVRYEWDYGLRQESYSVPIELKKAFSQDTEAKAIFDKLSPSCKREYVEFIDEAKRSETRARRVEKTLAQLRGQA